MAGNRHSLALSGPSRATTLTIHKVRSPPPIRLPANTNGDRYRRCLWHLGGCAASLYFFMSILHITSDNLPQWLPTIIDCGIGASLGFQAIPSSARERVGEAITSVIGGIFSGTQVIVRRDEERHLSENEPSSTRRRRADIEEGLVS